MEIQHLDVHDESLVHQLWQIGRLAEAERPYDFYPPWDVAWKTYQNGRDDLDFVPLGAFDEGRMVGAARVDVPLLDNLHSAWSQVYVDPAHVRRGIGRALDAACVEVARGRGRRVLMTEALTLPGQESPGLLFARAMGYRPGLEDGLKVVDLFETEHTWAALDEATLPHRDGYRIVTWHDNVPEELLDDFCLLNEAFFEEAPIGEMEMEPEKWDRARVAEREARNAATGRHEISAGALSPEGRLVALTELMVNEATPWRGHQSGTLVDRDHRGHRLGMAVKLANHRQVREAWPEVKVVMTGNADVNAAMNAVNDALGYREVERCVEMQKDV